MAPAAAPAARRRAAVGGHRPRPQVARRPRRRAAGRHRQHRWLQRLVRLGHRAGGHQPPLCRRPPAVQLHPRAQPARKRFPRRLAGRGAAREPRRPSLRAAVAARRHRRAGGQPPGVALRPRALSRDRPPREDAVGGLRGPRRSPLQGGQALLRDQYQLQTSSSCATCGWSTPRRSRSATSAARSTTGCGRATPATSVSFAPTWRPTASLPTIPRRTYPTGPRAGCVSPRATSIRATR